MKVGVVKEQKAGEGRVAVTPENVKKLVDAGATVLVEKSAGVGAGFPDADYAAAGGTIVSHAQSWDSDLVVKVKEPDEEEYQYFKPGQVVWGFQHLASSPATVKAMQAAGTTAIGGETIVENGELALLKPMSAIAGRRSVIMGAYYLEAQHGGEGILLPGTPEVASGMVVIFGGGNAAFNAASLALAMGCRVTIIELKKDRRDWLAKQFTGEALTLLPSTPENLAAAIKTADVFISTILIPGAKPPKLVTTAMVQSMKPGSVLVDVAIDQGGTVETIDAPTSIDDPVFTKYDVIHYAVPNQPGAVPRTATMALAVGNIKYLLAIAKSGIDAAIKNDPALASGVNLYHGQVTNKGLAESLNLPVVSLETALKTQH